MNRLQEKQSQTVAKLVADLFIIDSAAFIGDKLNLRLVFRYEKDKSRKFLTDRLKMAGYRFEISEDEQYLYLSIDPKAKLKIPPLNILLFILTFFSIYFVPVFLRSLSLYSELDISGVVSKTFEAMSHGVGLEFTIAMISILFVHEMGHFIAGRRRDIITSWPYFIPAPNIIGTFGAVIKSKSPFWNRRDLIEVGAWGPIAGWVLAVIWLFYGLAHTIIIPPDVFTEAAGFSLDGESILMRLAVMTVVGDIPAGYYYGLSEAAFAGWVGLLVTSINMLPIGQLDGGHVLYGLGRKIQHKLGFVAMAALILFGFQSQMWWFFAGFGLIFGVRHPKTLNDNIKPDRKAVVLGWIAVFILIISFTPIPFN